MNEAFHPEVFTPLANGINAMRLACVLSATCAEVGSVLRELDPLLERMKPIIASAMAMRNARPGEIAAMADALLLPVAELQKLMQPKTPETH